MAQRAPGPPRQQLATIAFLTMLLVFVLLTRRRCAEGTAGLFKAIEGPAVADGGARATDAGTH